MRRLFSARRRRRNAWALLRHLGGTFLTENGALGPNPAGAQCVNVANSYLERLGLDSIAGNARDFATFRSSYVKWIDNRPSNYPRAGDIVVWLGPPASPFGHVAVSLHSDRVNVIAVAQDWPSGAPVGLMSAFYAGVAGWLRPL